LGNLKNLTHLKLGFESIEREEIEEIKNQLINLPSLSSLSFQTFLQRSDGFVFIENLSFLRELKKLTIFEYIYRDDSGGISDKIILGLCFALQDLKSLSILKLDLRQCTSITPLGKESLIKLVKDLTSLFEARINLPGDKPVIKRGNKVIDFS